MAPLPPAQPPFQVELARSGGIANIEVRVVVRSWELSEREAEQLERLLDAADLMALPPEPRPPPGGDRFQFDLAWQRDDESGFLRTYDGEMPTGLRALIDWLLARD